MRTFRGLIRTGLIALTVSTMVALTKPAQALPTQIKQFYANCHNFSADVDVLGMTDDGNGLDRFQYKITDGLGNTLYQEAVSRPTGQLGINLVMNVDYTTGSPAKNPVTLSVIDLDSAGNPVKALRSAQYDASCLAASEKSATVTRFAIPESYKLSVHAESAFFNAPGGHALALHTRPGENWFGLYRSADNQWVGVYANSNELMWLPANVVEGPYAMLPVRPTQIEHVVAPNVPTGVTVTPLGITILRTAPSEYSENVGHIDAPSIWVVTGRNAAADWIQIDYNGKRLWVSGYHACLMNGEMLNLPVVG